MKRIILSLLLLLTIISFVACGKKEKGFTICDINIGKLEYENINIMGVTYDFYDNGYAFLNGILHENAQIVDAVSYENKEYTVIGIGGLDEKGHDANESVFGFYLTPNKSPANLVLPDTAVIIMSHALSYSSAETIDLPSNLKIMGDYVFQGCANLKTIDFPESLEFIGGNCFFFGCSSLEYIELPKNCDISYPINFFTNCESLKSVTIPSNMTASIAGVLPNVFGRCYELEEVVLEEGIEKILNGAFYDCPKLKTLIIPDSVKIIEDGAFRGCTGLIDLTLSDNMTDVSSQLFHNLATVPEYNPNLTIRVKADMVNYVQSLYPDAEVINK